VHLIKLVNNMIVPHSHIAVQLRPKTHFYFFLSVKNLFPIQRTFRAMERFHGC